MKDIDCPDKWADELKRIIPESVYYLNECIESRTGGDGAILEPNEWGQMRYGKGVAPAGDLMSSLPPDMRAMNMMCYIGHEGTYTPAHREMCASLGQNIMIEASEDGRGEKAGSSIWLMTETSERELVSEYFLSMLGHDIEVEKHFAQLNAWKKAPFNVWVVEQRVGDLILIPPLAPHQVWNRGTRTIKAAWNRTTVDTLELALHEALPRARMVCRDEQYKCKAIIYYTLANYYELLQRDTIEPKMWKYGRIKQLLDDFKRLFDLYQEVLVSEMFSPKLPEETNVEMLPYDSNVTCSYCRCNIFNRFLTCKACILEGDNGVEDTYDICMDCYAMGRSCACISNLSWVEQWDWSTLVQNYETWRNIVVQSDGFFDARRSPQTIDIARKRYGKKPIAEVCQEQLKIRPWTDITKPRELTPDMSDIEPEVDDEGRLKPRKGVKKAGKRKGPDRTKGKTHACHICCHHEWDWKLAFCTTCNLTYCYGTLFRAFDLMPQTVMEDKEWQCPKCMKMCSCGKCRRANAQKGSNQTPYQPKGTLLGHDTKKVADYRSVESLVDFSKTNLGWLRDENAQNPHETERMKRLKEKAIAEKSRVDLVDESYIERPHGDGDNPFLGAEADDHAQSMAEIDPELRGPVPTSTEDGFYRSPYNQTHAGVNGNGAKELRDQASNDCQDDQHDLDDHDPYNNPDSTDYPSRLLVPVAPVIAPEKLYPDPTHIGQTRMMGIGYYQQQGNAPDRILYDAPNEYGNSPKQLSFSQNPNLAFSDLLDSQLQADQAKKRKRHGDGDEDDVEFFTSKKQKALANKQARSDEQVHDDFGSRPDKVPSRRSIAKVKSYVDLGEDAVPIEDDEGPSMLSSGGPAKRKPENKNSDLELVAQALSRLGQPKSKEKAPVKRRSFRSRPENDLQSPSVKAPNTIKTPRRSAWLARKEAEDGSEFLAELPKRTRQRRSTDLDTTAKSTLPAIEICSGHSFEEEEEGAGVNIDLISDVDSLFGEPIEKEKDKEEENFTWHPSEVGPHIKVAEINHRAGNEDISEPPAEHAPIQEQQADTLQVLLPEIRSEEELQKPSAKRRGRPPKKGSAPPLATAQLDSPSPPPARATPQKLLSLKEKLAAKGKSFRIVASRAQPSSSGPPNAKISSMTESIIENSSARSPVRWNNINKNIKASFASDSGSSRTATPGDTSAGKSASAPCSTLPKSKGPTVVRLVSPESDFEEPEPQRYTSEESDADDSSSDDIPAVRASATKMSRGGIVSLRGRGSGRGRGRGRPRGRASH
jgi:hypothetical protein